MSYIPKNKIQTNLYTSGGEYTTLNGEIYVGYYYKLYDGTSYTGRNQNEKPNLQLSPLVLGGDEFYKPLPTSTPYSPLLPTPQDYQNGEFVRYFVCRINQPFFIEIDKTTFNRYKQKDPTISWKLYKPFSLFWVLTGDINQVAQTNKNVTEFTEQKEKVEGLSVYVKEDWTQYYKN
jgi:hypothetical protein